MTGLLTFGRAGARLRLAWEPLQRSPGFWALVLGLSLVAAVGVSLTQGAVHLPLGRLAGSLLDVGDPMHRIVRDVRLPRILVAGLVGAALAVAGALFQTAVRNPLADAGLLGVSAGAGVAALIGIVLIPELALVLPLLAFAGALLAVGAVLAVAWGGGATANPLRIILSGVAIQALLFSAIAVITFLYADRAPAFVAFTVGSLNGCGWREVAMAAGPVTVGLGLAGAALRPLDLLLLDDDSASGVGLAVRRARIGAFCLAALLAAAAVSVAGLIGFVGLLVPNWVRIATGPAHRSLLPLSALGGAALLVVADLAARTLAAPVELPVGALLSFLGGPYFLFLLWRRLA